MSTTKKEIKGGVYLVVDPSALNAAALDKIRAALDSGLAAIQVWNNWKEITAKAELIQQITQLTAGYNTPVLVNENYSLLTETDADGVHFDRPTENLALIRAAIDRDFISGVTCGNDLNTVQYAIDYQMDYISFCSVFPSSSANSCEWVQPATIAAARAITNMPVFAAGGITASNLPDILHTGLDGIAVINSIMKADDPAKVTAQFNQILQQKEHKNAP
ncbi:thiamine phosphate synthase [Pseudoflavitalea sp. G-6-1-2]|uniref:thiamine phosphate synthase n=1 Tax=Pseudoflavitalea sp. G-6-1-2 TaxID=2728841 RepID=UPI00146F0949|nr:thiamine phosphate synthase [Pseudoflavitalea sp. G-6-1-2]NML20059.1 thiamine phosphate synthase [Pseudoflavitalea sp. G-6-1-2]